MDDSAVELIEREQAFVDFDHARNDLMDLYARVPDESFGYKPEGDEYTIGYVLLHVASVLHNYSRLLDLIREAAWGEVRPLFPERAPLDTAAERAPAVAEIEQLHDALASRMRELTPAQFEEKAQVYFPDTQEPYPTAPRDILTWLTDHYREHVPHVQALVEGWRESNRET